MEPSQRARLQKELEAKIRGDVLFDEMSRFLYSTDASLYQIKPLGVILPKNKEDVIQAIRTAAKYKVPILPRGGGTSLAGQTVSPGLVIDCSKYMTRVLEINRTQKWVRTEPGVVLDNLNDFLKFYGLFFAPDVATSSRATIGGMAGNNSAGVRSVRYGKTVDHVLAVSAILATGEELELRSLNRTQLKEKMSRQDREGEIYRSVHQITTEHAPDIRDRFPKVMRRVGGYNLDELLDDNSFNLAKLLVGSEGTLGFITEIKVNLETIPAARLVLVLHFQRLSDAIDAVHPLLAYSPTAVEILDHYGLDLASQNPAVAELCRQFIQGVPEAVLIVEFSGESASELEPLVARLQSDPALGSCYNFFEAWEAQPQSVIWQVRKSTLGVLLGMKGDAKPLAFVEDAGIPVEHLSAYIENVLQICRRHRRPLAMYAHASVGVIHVRPILNLKQPEDVEIMRSISEEVFELVVRFGGSWSGEHGDGLVRSYKNREFFGETIYGAFQAIKKVFDPEGLMNPGKITDAQPMTENLRIHPDYRAGLPETFFKFRAETGFDRAVEMCTGVGHCRKTLGGTMCPSYMATRDEEHSTRGRANALRLAMTGQFDDQGLTSHRLHDVLDLCLECKACKSECPSNVDMARLKAEFLTHYYAAHGLPAAKKMFAQARRRAEQASHAPWLFNLLLQNGLLRRGLDKFAGIDRRRRLPAYASPTMEKWFRKRTRKQSSQEGPRVALYLDTFVNFYEPQIGMAAVRILEGMGYQLDLVEAGCCGRPLISSGLLPQVVEGIAGFVARAEQAAGREGPIIVLEPSCLSTIRDDYPDLATDTLADHPVFSRFLSLEEFLCAEGHYQGLSEKVGAGPAAVLFHAHCQQKALMGSTKSLRALASLKNSRIVELDSGCCGMAGSFGYEKKHYAISEQIGARRLFPAVRNGGAGVEVVASGFSCRSQIRHFTGKKALHLAEILAAAMDV